MAHASTNWYDCRINKAEQICIAARLRAGIHFKAEERPESGAALAALAERMGEQPDPPLAGVIKSNGLARQGLAGR